MKPKTVLFTPLKIKSVEFKNRIWVSPMCQYSSENGHPTDWHFVHLGSRAIGGAGMVMVEATAVSPEGRISPADSGIWSDDHIPGFKKITDFLHFHGSLSGIQLAHAGRKASTAVPWRGHHLLSPNEGGWETLAPSPIPFTEGNPPPRELDSQDLARVIRDFESATERSLAAGFRVLELHMAHGYLMHEFLSPLSNRREDEYGGKFENRIRFPLEVARAVRKKWPDRLPLFVRISATDWLESETTPSWTLSESLLFCKELRALGVDLIDCSSGAILPDIRIPVGPGFQVPFAEAIREKTGIMTAAVGLITEPQQAESILAEKKADALFIGREFLRNPYWPISVARFFGEEFSKPNQYARS